MCHLCALPGHKLFDCPYKSAATEAAAADVKLGVTPSRRRGGTALAAVSPEVLPSGVVSLSKSAKAAVRAWHTAALLALVSDDASTDPDDDDGRPLIGLDTMSDNHLIFDRSLFVQSSIKRLNPPILIEGATGALEFTEQGDLYVNSILITGALFCPTSPYHLLSVGRLVRDYPSWDWALPSRPVPVLQAWSSAGRLLISAVQRDELFLFRCSLGPQPCAAPVRQLHSRARSFPLRRPPPSLARLRSPLAGLALPAVALAAPVPAVVAPVPPAVPNIPLSIDSLSLSYSEFMWWHRQLGHPSLGPMRWYLHAYPQLDFGKMPSSLFCVACSEGKSHRASMRAARAGLDPLEASVGDGFSVDIKTSTTPGCENFVYTAIVVSRRTKFVWALHAATKDLLRAKLRAWYIAYTLRYSAVNGPLLMFRADNDAALFPPADTAFWDSYGVVLSFSAPYTPWLNGLAESFIRTVYMCARTLLRDSELENYWWPYAVSHAVYLLNRRPSSRSPHVTPYERLLKVAPLPPMLAWGSVGHWSPPAEHPIQVARHTFSPRGFACHFLGYSGESASTMMILCAGQVFATVDVVFPRLGALQITRDSRSGSLNFGAAADLASRSEVFDFAAPPGLPGAVKSNLSQVPLFLADHDRDCGLCTKRKVGRLLLCCSTCSAVAHLKCAGLRRPPASEWHCAPCSRPSVVAARLVPVVAAVSAPVPLAVVLAPPLPSVVTTLPFPLPLPGGAPGVVPAVAPLASSRRPPRLRGSVPAASPAVLVDPVLPGTPSLASPLVAPVSGSRSSSRLLARSPAVSVVSSRTGELARVHVVAQVLAGFNEAGTSRVLPAALVSAVREVQSRASPWMVPLAPPALAVPPPGLRSLPSRARAPPRVSTLGGRLLGGKADRARLFSLLARDQTPLMHDGPPMPGLSKRAPLPVPPVLIKDSVNPLTYPLFASQRASRTYPMYDSYAPEAGYDDGRPRLGQGFQHDAKRRRTCRSVDLVFAFSSSS